MSKFTKGKWKNNINQCVYVLDEKNKFPRFIVFHVCGNTEEEAQANARLIAAAPEMYQHLKLILNGEFSSDDVEQLLARIDGEAEDE